MPEIDQALADTLALLGSSDQEGSIRHHRSTVLTNQYAVSAQRAQDDLILSLAVVVRRLARQVARLSRLQTGTFDSADVGADAPNKEPAHAPHRHASRLGTLGGDTCRLDRPRPGLTRTPPM